MTTTPRCRILGLLALAAVLAAAAGEPPAEPAAEPPPGPRVVVLLGGDQDARGYLTYESNESVELRDLAGKLRSFPRSRVLKVVRLLDAAPGQRGVVLLRDGQRREGLVIDDGFDEVVLEIDGIQARFPRQIVDSVALQPTFEQTYARYRDAARTPGLRLELCRWLIQERRYDLARKELESLQESDPSPEAGQLLRLVQAQLDLQAASPAAPTPLAPPGSPASAPADGDPDGTGDDLDRGDEPGSRILSRDEVNLIRVYEIDLNRPPRLTIDADTIRTMLEHYAASPAIPASEPERRKLFRAPSTEVLELMFKLRARELYPQVQVLTEPWSLNQFRERVHNTWLINTCASTACHGGGDAGRFQIHRRHYRDERVRYTNLLILERLQVDPQWPLVNYEEPEASLLIQYGLPRDEARHAHPAVKGWKPVFDRNGKRMQRDAVSWIQSMMRPRPEYPIEFDPVPPGPAPQGEPPAGPPDPPPGAP